MAIYLVLSAIGCSQPQPSSQPPHSAEPPGIKLINPGEQVQAVPQDEAMALAFSLATDFAAANGNDIGYPWIDPVGGDLVLSAASTRGRELLLAASITVPYRIRDVTHGAAELERIQHDVTTLRAQGVPGADLIYETLPDHRDNRTLIGISAPSRELLDALAQRYDPSALAVRIAPLGQ